MVFGWGLALKAVTWIGQTIIGFLNAKVEADARVQISTNETIGTVAGAGLNAISKADELNAKRSPWEPIMILAAIILAFITYHTAFVVLDSVPWHIGLGKWFLPEWRYHVTGSWSVKALPGLFETTEHAILNSLFVGAAAAGATLAIIKGLRR